MGNFFKDVGDFVSDIVEDVVDFHVDAVKWVVDKHKEFWESDIGKIAIVAGAVYLGGWALTGNSSWVSAAFEGTQIIAETGGILSQGAAEVAVVGPGIESATAAEIAGTALPSAGEAVGVLEATKSAAALESVAGSSAIDLSLTGGANVAGNSIVPSAINAGAGDAAGSGFGAWVEANPTLAFGGLTAGGQIVSGYAAGEAQKDIEEQRLKEEEAERNRQNFYGVNYATGEGGIDTADKFRELNRGYFDSNRPEFQGGNDFQRVSQRRQQGVLNDIQDSANPNRDSHRAGVA